MRSRLGPKPGLRTWNPLIRCMGRACEHRGHDGIPPGCGNLGSSGHAELPLSVGPVSLRPDHIRLGPAISFQATGTWGKIVTIVQYNTITYKCHIAALLPGPDLEDAALASVDSSDRAYCRVPTTDVL